MFLSISSCTPALTKCFLAFTDYEKTYMFDCSKQQLKDRIIKAYTYDESLLSKNLGKTLIESERVNAEYQKSTDFWLDKQGWDKFKSKIRDSTADTLNILIGKHHSRNQTKLIAVVGGEGQTSSLTIGNFEYQRRKACEKDTAYYRAKLSKKIEKKFIQKLK